MSFEPEEIHKKIQREQQKVPRLQCQLSPPPLPPSLSPPPPLPPSFILLSLSSPLLSFNFCSPFPVKITGLLITFFSSILSESLVFLLETMFHLDGLAGLKLVILLSQPSFGDIYVILYMALISKRWEWECKWLLCRIPQSVYPSIYPSMHAFIHTCIHPYNTI